MKQIKQLVTTAPVLRYYNAAEPVTLQCDTCEWGLGAVILQNGQPVAYTSRTMSPCERDYAQIEKETLAIVFACERFDHYLCGQEHITVQSDHKPLEIILKKSVLSTTKRLKRMLLRLQRYNLNVTYVPGKYLYIADFLSRTALPAKQTDTNSLPYEVYQVQQSDCFVADRRNRSSRIL